MGFLDYSEQRKPDEDISKNPKVIKQYGEHEVKQPYQVIL